MADSHGRALSPVNVKGMSSGGGTLRFGFAGVGDGPPHKETGGGVEEWQTTLFGSLAQKAHDLGHAFRRLAPIAALGVHVGGATRAFAVWRGDDAEGPASKQFRQFLSCKTFGCSVTYSVQRQATAINDNGTARFALVFVITNFCKLAYHVDKLTVISATYSLEVTEKQFGGAPRSSKLAMPDTLPDWPAAVGHRLAMAGMAGKGLVEKKHGLFVPSPFPPHLPLPG